MTQMKILDIEPETLEKHLARYPDRLFIGWPEPLGKRGEYFIIEGHGVWKLDLVGDRKYSDLDYANSFSNISGFESGRELHMYLRKKFGSCYLYPHIFLMMQTEKQAKQKCLNMFFGGEE